MQKKLTICTSFGSSLHKEKWFLNLGARQHAQALEPQDHEAVTDCDDEDGHDEGKDEHADLQQSVPVPGGVREDQLAVNYAGGCTDTRAQNICS